MPTMPGRAAAGGTDRVAEWRRVWRGWCVELNTKQKAACAVLALAGVALCVDKFVLGGEATGPASSEAAEAPAPKAPRGAKAGPAKQTIAARLRAAAPADAEGASADAFAAPAAWFPRVESSPTAPASEPAPAAPAFRLTGVMKDVAVINGRVYRVGAAFAEEWEGRRREVILESVDPDARVAVLRMGDRRIEVSVRDENAGKAENMPRGEPGSP